MKLMIYFDDGQNKIKVTNALEMLLRHAIEATPGYEGVNGGCEVSLTFTDDEGIRELNSRYRGIDRATDVLSFPQIDFGTDGIDLSDNSYKILGDIVISLERAGMQAEEIGHSLEHEAAFLCVHSTLHLLGYDHVTGEEDEKVMFGKQKEIIASLASELAAFDRKGKEGNAE